MLKRILLTLTALTMALTLALGAIAATPEGASAANGGRDCFTFQETEGFIEGCETGGSGKGGGGGRADVVIGDPEFSEGSVGITVSGGSGKGGGGGRFCITVAGQTECEAGPRRWR